MKTLNELKLQLQYHTELNPKLWDEFVLKPEVRAKLLQFAEVWREFAKIPKDAVSDVYMLGGNCNYNYTDKSDIDVHIIVDKKKISDDPLLDDYLRAKKMLWTLSHNVTILGYGLEPYAQDTSEEGLKKDQGVYSLMNNEWVAKPEFIGDDMLKNPMLKKKVKFYMDMIDDMVKNHVDTEAFDNLKEKLREMRGAAIKKGGEFSFENLVFKELRNHGYIDKISNYTKSEKDKELSL